MARICTVRLSEILANMPIQTLFPLGHWSGISYLLRDLFTANASAPLSSPRTCEPGPGTLTLVQNDGQFSISGGALSFPAEASFAWGNQGLSAPVSRVNGMFIGCRLTFSSAHNLWQLGYGNGVTATGYENWLTYSNQARIGTPDLPQFKINNSIAYDMGIILASVGAYHVQRIGPGETYIIHYITRSNNTASGSGRFTNGSAVGTLTNYILARLGYPWLSNYGPATGYIASPTSGATIATQAEMLIEFTWTPGAGEIIDIQFRRTDDNNCWIIRCDQANGTIKLFERQGGVETERNSGKTQTWTVGIPRRILIKAYATTIESYVADVAKHSYTDALFNQTATGAKVSGFATGLNFAATPYRVVLPNMGFSTNDYFLAYGDSKTWGSGDTGTLGVNGYPPLLAANLGTSWSEMLPRADRSGYTVALAQPVVGGDLLENSGYSPRYCLLNFGSNDATVMPTEANFKANYGYIIDAMHAKWSSARIGLMRPWRRGYDTQCDTLATWIGDLQAARSAFTFLGPDERVFLKSSDNGVTYTGDGVHPNHAGYVLTAQQWQTSMGL